MNKSSGEKWKTKNLAKNGKDLIEGREKDPHSCKKIYKSCLGNQIEQVLILTLIFIILSC
jgi:hypothetical protein